MVQYAEYNNVQETLPRLSNQELREIVSTCETAIAEGSARIEDYEAFVLAQQELARRFWL